MIYRFPCGARLPREGELKDAPSVEPGGTICVWSNHLPKGQNATSPRPREAGNDIAPCLFGCDRKERKCMKVMPEDGGQGTRYVVTCRPVVEEGGGACC